MHGEKIDVNKDHKMNSRYFIVDITAVTNHGHNVDGLYRMAEFIDTSPSQITFIMPKCFPEVKNPSYKIKRVLPDSYRFYHEPNFRVQRLPRKLKKIIRSAYLLFWFSRETLKVNQIINALNEEYKFSSEDTFFFPNADNLSTTAFVKQLSSCNSRFLIRFINVYEHLGIPRFWNFSKFTSFLQKKVLHGSYLTFGSETENYREWVSSHTHLNRIQHVPYPVKNLARHAKPHPSETMVIGVIGSARPDKGFEELPTLISLVDPECKFKFKVQTAVHGWGDAYLGTIWKLQSMKNVELLPAYLNDEEFDSSLSLLDAILLPYWPSTFVTRGSAMMVEALERRIPILAPVETAFGREVAQHNLGLTYLGPGNLRENILNNLRDFGNESYSDALHDYQKVTREKFAEFLTI